MKLLKKLLTAAVLGLAILPAISFAQPPGGGGRGRGAQTPEQQIAALETAVGTLTADQKTKITAIYTKAAEEMAKLAPEDRRGKGQDMRTATNKEVRALLTPEQATKFDAMPPPGRGGRPGCGAGGAPKKE
ncbi:MAG: hypothetical protein ABIO94_13640 [Opitutaceae bacterium]